MADRLTRFRSAITILTEDLANSLFGGLYNTTEGNTLDPDNPLVAGHIHDGQHLDGHAQKINLEEHTTGQLDGANIQDDSISESKLNFSVATGYLKIFADETERLADATVYTTGDLYGKALQVDTVVEYILTDVSPTTWSPLGGSEVATETLKILGMTNTFPLDPSLGQPIAITFAAAPSDILIKQFNVKMMKEQTTDSILIDLGELTAYFENIEINGLPLDFAGVGLLQVYSDEAASPIDINIPLSEGDVLSFDLYVTAGAPGSVNALYVNQPGTLPSSNYFIADSTSTVLSAPGTSATYTLTVNSAPTDGSADIVFQNRFKTTSTFGSSTFSLTPAGGARTSGQNDYDNTLGTPTLIAANIVAAINDSSNNFDTAGFSASNVGATITLTASLPGPIGNQISVDNDIPEISSTGTYFTGGALSSDTTLTLVAAPADGTITDIYIQVNNLAEDQANNFLTLKALKINGGSNELSSQISGDYLDPTNNNRNLNISIPINAGDIVTLEINGFYSSALFVTPMLIVTY